MPLDAIGAASRLETDDRNLCFVIGNECADPAIAILRILRPSVDAAIGCPFEWDIGCIRNSNPAAATVYHAGQLAFLRNLGWGGRVFDVGQAALVSSSTSEKLGLAYQVSRAAMTSAAAAPPASFA